MENRYHYNYPKLLIDNFYRRVNKNNARVSGEIPIEYKKKKKPAMPH